jgi:hypothetical protein
MQSYVSIPGAGRGFHFGYPIRGNKPVEPALTPAKTPSTGLPVV